MVSSNEGFNTKFCAFAFNDKNKNKLIRTLFIIKGGLLLNKPPQIYSYFTASFIILSLRPAIFIFTRYIPFAKSDTGIEIKLLPFVSL